MASLNSDSSLLIRRIRIGTGLEISVLFLCLNHLSTELKIRTPKHSAILKNQFNILALPCRTYCSYIQSLKYN